MALKKDVMYATLLKRQRESLNSENKKVLFNVNDFSKLLNDLDSEVDVIKSEISKWRL